MQQEVVTMKIEDFSCSLYKEKTITIAMAMDPMVPWEVIVKQMMEWVAYRLNLDKSRNFNNLIALLTKMLFA